MDESVRPNRYLTLSREHLTPHSALFFAFNCLYLGPVIGAFLFRYSEGGTDVAADLEPGTLAKMALMYVAGVLAFWLGSRMGSDRAAGEKRRLRLRVLRLFELSTPFWLVCFLVVVALLISKVLLIPLGVYSEYAFDTESMTGGVWTFSMACSEFLVVLSIAALFSRATHNVIAFVALSAINAVNLLHGTRIFFIVSVIAFCFYGYVRGKLTWRIMVLGAVLTLSVGYLVFLLRSHVNVDSETFSFVRLISPVMYESIFSQISLFEVIRNPNLWNLFGAPQNLVSDVAYFVVPRFLFPDKDKMLFINQFSDLSPLGAFSGYAQGLIYLGILFPIFYFLLGWTANRLLRKAETSSFWFIVYVYVVCDVLFRIMRDGYIIPIKAVIDALMIMGLIRICENSLGFISLDAPSTRHAVAAVDHDGSEEVENG
jgi:hypothetical protein